MGGNVRVGLPMGLTPRFVVMPFQGVFLILHQTPTGSYNKTVSLTPKLWGATPIARVHLRTAPWRGATKMSHGKSPKINNPHVYISRRPHQG